MKCASQKTSVRHELDQVIFYPFVQILVNMAQELTTSRQWFTDTGTTICTWAASHGFSKELVYAVLSGRIRGVRGEAFHVRRKLLEITGAMESASNQTVSHQGLHNQPTSTR